MVAAQIFKDRWMTAQLKQTDAEQKVVMQETAMFGRTMGFESLERTHALHRSHRSRRGPNSGSGLCPNGLTTSGSPHDSTLSIPAKNTRKPSSA